MKSNEILLFLKEKFFEITGDPCNLIGSHGHDEHHKMEQSLGH